jgi:phospholipid/cholesterol/gamma-HCH transport system substrate-binding protein
MTDQLKNILIGLFVVVAITIAVSMILFLEPNVGDGKQTLIVRFANVSGISTGTRVTFAGKPVGEVAEIATVPNARDQHVDEGGRVFLYELTLKLDSSVQFYTTDEVAIRTTGLMGERSIAILPKQTPKDKTLELVTDQVIYANSIDPLENSISQVAKVATRVQTTVEQFDGWFLQNKDHLAGAIRSFDGTLSRMTTFLDQVDREKIIPSLNQSLGLLSQNLESTKRALDDDQLLYKTSALLEKLNRTASVLNTDGASALRYMTQIGRDISTGSGTIGRFINSEDFYLRLSSITGKVETLMNDINHYGILFQYDKSWQRGRTKKANFLKALETPNEFRTYFEGEVDTIQTSLGRLTELLDRASEEKERQKVFQNESFKRDFAMLLRQVQSLSDSIKLYNEELVAQSNES